MGGAAAFASASTLDVVDLEVLVGKTPPAAIAAAAARLEPLTAEPPPTEPPNLKQKN